MKMLLLGILFILFIIFSFTVFSINTDSGYFQKECCGCKVDYLPSNYQENMCVYAGACVDTSCSISLIDRIKLELARFDYVR